MSLHDLRRIAVIPIEPGRLREEGCDLIGHDEVHTLYILIANPCGVTGAITHEGGAGPRRSDLVCCPTDG